MTRAAPPPSQSGRQNAQLTFKHNVHHGRHGWLRLTPAYSVKLVTEILAGKNTSAKVLDPFSGTGTTALCAAYLGFVGTGLEINPFLVWFSLLKSRQFQPTVVERTRDLGESIATASSPPHGPKLGPPPIHNIARWWNSPDLDFLCRLKACIYAETPPAGEERDLLLVAFCRTAIKLSNAAFNHQSMSFKEKENVPLLFDLSAEHSELFRGELSCVLEGAADNPCTPAYIVPGDARRPSRHLSDQYDILVTSPPYPNRISYIRELRPYMYWLDFLANGRDAGELDWQAIGGTWGIATSRLADWKPSSESYVPQALKTALQDISNPVNRNGGLLANYVGKYFEDIWRHIDDVHRVLNKDAEVHYIVGNSTFYGVLLPVEEIYKNMLEQVGFRDVRILRLRKRNSKAELFEYDVTGKWK